jgi:hypothetical protein
MKVLRIRKPETDYKPAGRVCPDCNLRRTPHEFQFAGKEFKNCKNCWAKHGRRER